MDSTKDDAIFSMKDQVRTLLTKTRELCDKIPESGDYVYLTAFPEFTTLCNNVKTMAVVMYQQLFDMYEPENGLSLLEIPHLEVGGDYEIVSQLEEFMFAMIESCLDEVDNPDVSPESVNELIKNTQERIHFPLIHYDSEEKPQKNFDDVVDALDLNFAPKLRVKHNQIKPWVNEQISRIPGLFFQDDYMRELGIDPKTQLISIYRNPYSYEIHNIEFPEWELSGNVVFNTPSNVEELELISIVTEDGIVQLIKELQECNVISVSVIQHSYRSYLGYCSVIMISSPKGDYMVDAIQCHSSCHLLNEVFTNPQIVKVMFDCKQALLWLQRDFGIFMVNLFDLDVAINMLNKKKDSLDEMVYEYTQQKVNMRYKRADWRTRPLTAEMETYALSTTHYNMFIFGRVMKELQESQQNGGHMIGEALAACNEMCLKTYHKPVQTYETGELVIAELGLLLSPTEKMIFLSLYYWRDVVARENDESTQFILPLIQILHIAKVKPTTLEALKRILKSPSYVVKERKNLLLKIVEKCLQAKESDVYKFPQFVQEACADGSENLQIILRNDRCLFSGIRTEQVEFPMKNNTIKELSQYEASENPTNDQLFRVMNNKGKFRVLSSSTDSADKFLVYTPNTLPYNERAPLRNTVPFIPLKYTEEGVTIDPIIGPEYINPGVASFVNNINMTLTEEQRQEHAMIREELKLDHIRSELCHLGSVVEDDAISLSPDAKELVDKFSAEYDIELPEGLPPCSLKEIYQLPHKGKGREEVDDNDKKKKANSVSGEPSFDIAKILNVESTEGLSDDVFMRKIGWTEEAARKAEEESKNILKPFM